MRDPCGKLAQVEDGPLWEMGTHGGEIYEEWALWRIDTCGGKTNYWGLEYHPKYPLRAHKKMSMAGEDPRLKI